MKPKPYMSVHDMLASDGKLPALMLPYDTYLNEKAGFVTIALRDDFVAFGLLTMRKASLRAQARIIVLELPTGYVRIDGEKLEDLFEDILRGKVRVIRTGKHPACSVDAIRFAEVDLS